MPKVGLICEKYRLAVGQKFGKLTVTSVTPVSGGYAQFSVVCECGQHKEIRACNVVNGNSESCGCGRTSKRKLPFGMASLNKLYGRYKNNAKHTSRDFSLKLEDFKTLTSSPCHYCGDPPSLVVQGETSNGPYVYNGLDRVDNSRGYHVDNVVPACIQCQFAKRDQSKDYFLDWLKRAAKFQHFDT